VDALIGALVLFLLGLGGARLSFTTAGMPLGARFLFVAGTHFLLIGYILGPVIGLLSRDVIAQFFPLLALGLAWVGLLFGLQLDVRQLRKFPVRFTMAALLQGVVAFAVFFVLAALALLPFFAPTEIMRAALLAGAATACVSSPLGLSAVAVNVRGRMSELLLYIGSLDALVGIVALQLVFALNNPLRAGGLNVAIGAEWILAAIAVGVAFAIFLTWLTRPKPDRDELVLFLLGSALFLGGASLYLGVSTLFVATVAGMIVGNASPMRRRLFTVLQEWEKPIYVIILLLLGALVVVNDVNVIPLALGYALVRVVAKLAGGWVAARIVRPRLLVPDTLGLGLLTQGGMSLVIVLSVLLAYGGLDTPDPVLTSFTTAVVIGVLLSELFGPFFTRRLLRSAGELAGTDAAARPTVAEAGT
jgi:hypothetical protein